MSAVDLFADRLEDQVESRTIYRHTIPNRTTVAQRYLWVYSNTPQPSSIDLGDSQTLRDVTVWVTSASRNADQQVAATEAMWGAEKAAEALKGWRPQDGAWKPVPLGSLPPQRDDDLPDAVVVFTVQQWGWTYQP